ncbi:BZ3500_MvSof-1268-A1-R1_Chr3-2g06318 [Microbotryum saponariae]|uniref:BZ3500_MvSof-1268-A1-R1_Chr3-2g06318 protein n=1 Tax=Microbotryum saponariae TaxID=289078 RepID=A0A2X0KZ41_9BASI|nr:BZ3500_MvSof-1268-A1-R1_Chr3-2g06318 [Microbotryum saponariae]SDA04289.1 BZ3501_MvSof-1269-A2-R1_Chr3-2g06009 [Microbotryum saponariae]
MHPTPLRLLRQSTVAHFHPSSLSHLKLLALPLTRLPTKDHSPSFLLQAKRLQPIPSESPSAQSPTSGSSLGEGQKEVGKRQLSYVTRATLWASGTWEGFGKADEGTWKRRAYVIGARFMDKIEFEEWALKAIDPALSPKPWAAIKAGSDGVAARRQEDKVSLIYPSSILKEPELKESLRKQLDHREPLHKKAMYKCILFAPLTFPFAIIPVVPNFPLFYVLWRAWSHYRAWKASQYLSTLLSTSQLSLTPSKELDKIYSSTSTSTSSTTSSENQVVLTMSKVPEIVRTFGLSGEEEGELKRAVVQCELRVKQLNGEGEAKQGGKKE